jgi:NAD(P)-dependent dehydrogenase (short-subunit alcohol dehydrogenase family)
LDFKMLYSSMDPCTLDGKIAVITGSTQGLGEAIARLFAARGARGLVICGRQKDKGEALARDLTKDSCKAVFVPADLERLEDCAAITAAADRHFGGVDILVNAAGITDRGTILDTSPDLFDRMMAVNLRAPFFLMQNAAKLMIRDKRKGSIINILSVSGHGGQSFISAYCTSKGGLATLTKNTANALMRSNIRVNGLMIGWMDTPGEDRIMKTYHGAADGWKERAEAGRPMGRLLKTEEVARACAYLASEESGLMTGALIDFDQQVIGAQDDNPMPPLLT